MITYIVLALLIIGSLLILIASIGLLKMPDIYLRMSASTIAGTLGVATVLIAVIFYFRETTVILHVTGIIIFLVLTVPIGAHILGRASHNIGLKMWDKTVCDDLEGKYRPETNEYENPDTNQLKDNQ